MIELFKAPVIGQHLEDAILNLINGLKCEYFSPPSVEMSNITTIWKQKGSKNSLESDRGVFFGK